MTIDLNHDPHRGRQAKPKQMDERPRIESALAVLDPDCDRDTWVRIGQAIQDELGEEGFSLWDEWSRTGSNYREASALETWRSFGQGRGITIGTLFKLARDAGWSDDTPAREMTPEEVEARRRSREEAARKNAEEAERVKAQARAWSAAIITATQPARPDHPYLTRKRVRPTPAMLEIGAAELQRILGYQPNAAGEPLTGRVLAIPLERFGEPGPCTVEMVDESGRKAALAGPGTKTGAHGCLSAPQQALDTVLVGEGAATVLSALDALAGRNVAGFMTSCNTNMPKVAQAIRAQYPAAQIVLLADLKKDTGEPDPKAMEAAQACSGLLAVPNFGPGWTAAAGTDFNDLAIARGIGAVKACIESARAAQHRFNVLRRDDLMGLPNPEWIIKLVMPGRGVGAEHGPSMVGKTFVAIDQAACIAEGRDWFGFRVKKRPVAYVALEGQAGFKLRIMAWEKHHGRKFPGNVILIPDPIDVRRDEDVSALCAVLQRELEPGAVVYIDTLNRAAPGMEENSSKDYGLILAGAQRIEEAVKGFVCFIAHPGKDASKGLRGHYSMFAGLDMNLELIPDPTDSALFSWTVRKVKDGPDGTTRHFRRVEVDLFEDEDGDQVTSCVVVQDFEADKTKRSAKKAMTKNEANCFEAFKQAAMEYGEADQAGNFTGLHLEDWRAYFYATSTAPTQDAKRTAFNKAKGALTRSGWLFENVDGMLRPDGPGADIHEHNISEAIRERTGRTEPNQDRTGSAAESPRRRTEPNHTPLGVVRGSLGSAEPKRVEMEV